MYPQNQEVLLYDNVTPVTVTSSTDATPVVVTATAHGFTTGQRVLIYGHTTNVAANGIYVVGATTANTFALTDEITGANVAGSGAGSGSGGIAVKAPPVMLITGFRDTVFQIDTSGTATMTLKAVGSQGGPSSLLKQPRGAYPNIGATVSPTNPYSFLQLINLDSAASLAGSTGLVIAGTDVNNQFEVNVNTMRWCTLIPVSWSAGALSVKAMNVTNA